MPPDLRIVPVGVGLALLLGNRGQGASGFFGSETDSETDAEPETA
jgi:hypothetical protein